MIRYITPSSSRILQPGPEWANMQANRLAAQDIANVISQFGQMRQDRATQKLMNQLLEADSPEAVRSVLAEHQASRGFFSPNVPLADKLQMQLLGRTMEDPLRRRSRELRNEAAEQGLEQGRERFEWEKEDRPEQRQEQQRQREQAEKERGRRDIQFRQEQEDRARRLTDEERIRIEAAEDRKQQLTDEQLARQRDIEDRKFELKQREQQAKITDLKLKALEAPPEVTETSKWKALEKLHDNVAKQLETVTDPMREQRLREQLRLVQDQMMEKLGLAPYTPSTQEQLARYRTKGSKIEYYNGSKWTKATPTQQTEYDQLKLQERIDLLQFSENPPNQLEVQQLQILMQAPLPPDEKRRRIEEALRILEQAPNVQNSTFVAPGGPGYQPVP